MDTVTTGNNQEKRPILSRFFGFIDFRFILARYIIREHIGPFFFAFVIIIFILIIDFVPQLVDMVVGKDLPVLIILRVFFYQLAWMVALAVPMAVLVATLMAFGRLTSDFETIAIKSSGIHILRLIYPIALIAILLTIALIEFGNYALPEFNHRARIIMQDVRRMRPTLKIRGGAFINDITGYIILIDSVNHTTSEIKGVKILELGRKRKAPRTIVAQDGFLTFANEGRDLIFDLRDGEIHEFDDENRENYRRLAFQTQRIIVTEIAKEFQESDDQFRTDREKSAEKMMEDVRKWKAGIAPYRDKIANLVSARYEKYFTSILPPSPDSTVVDTIALNNLKREEEANSRIIARETNGVDSQNKLVRQFMVEVHKKYSIPVACIAFVLIGAPLGILAKRGSMGISIGISLGLFVIYWAFLIGGEDLADRGIVAPWVAMWVANALIGIAGIYLIYIVSTEKPLWTIFRLTRPK